MCDRQVKVESEISGLQTIVSLPQKNKKINHGALDKGGSSGREENLTKMRSDNCILDLHWQKRTGIFMAETKFNQREVT